eukprot:511986-Amphidinium_carterae.2
MADARKPWPAIRYPCAKPTLPHRRAKTSAVPTSRQPYNLSGVTSDACETRHEGLRSCVHREPNLAGKAAWLKFLRTS